MEMEFTARQVDISKALRATLRKQAEDGMERIARILGKTARANVIFCTQKHLQVVEITVQVHMQTFAAAGEADTFDAALRQAIEHIESQVVRYRDRRLESKRLPKEEKVLTAPPVTRPKARVTHALDDGERNSVAATPSFTRAAVVEPHILEGSEAIASQPLTIEEAVKDAEFHDRDLLIFHNPAGEKYVLHRRRDGQMELAEIP